MAEPMVAPHMVLGAGGNGPAVITYTNTGNTFDEIIAPGFFADPQPSNKMIKPGDFMFIASQGQVRGLVTVDETHPAFVFTEVSRSA